MPIRQERQKNSFPLQNCTLCSPLSSTLKSVNRGRLSRRTQEQSVSQLVSLPLPIRLWVFLKFASCNRNFHRFSFPFSPSQIQFSVRWMFWCICMWVRDIFLRVLSPYCPNLCTAMSPVSFIHYLCCFYIFARSSPPSNDDVFNYPPIYIQISISNYTVYVPSDIGYDLLGMPFFSSFVSCGLISS